jgi:hypothetical protein
MNITPIVDVIDVVDDVIDTEINYGESVNIGSGTNSSNIHF